MKPHPSIFAAALQLVDVPAGDAVMVGDSVRQDVEGALRAGMRAVLLHRGDGRSSAGDELSATGVPVIRSLRSSPRSSRALAASIVVSLSRESCRHTLKRPVWSATASPAATPCCGRRADAGGCERPSARRRGWC